MKAYDSAGNQLSQAWIHTSGTVNTKKMGSYPVTYSLTDSFGRNASVTVTYTVGDASKATISGVRKEITKEYKSTVNLRSKVTAKNSMGTVLTDKIVTKVRKPGTKEYKGVRAENLKLNHTGTYLIMYYLKNPTNKLVTEEYMKIIVKATKKPEIKSKDNFSAMKLEAGTASVNYKKLISGVTAKLVSGKNMTSRISIKVTDPDGKLKTVSKNGSYKFAGAGTYTVHYYCSNPEKSLKTGKYLVAEKKRTGTADKSDGTRKSGAAGKSDGARESGTAGKSSGTSSAGKSDRTRESGTAGKSDGTGSASKPVAAGRTNGSIRGTCDFDTV